MGGRRPVNSALVLFSGGQDSATCLAWALHNFDHVETIAFDYGQKHRIELEGRPTFLSSVTGINKSWELGSDHFIKLDIQALANSVLTGGNKERTDGLPNTFVPGRNLIFFLYAAVVAERQGLKHIIGGMCETDYSGYPDCRDDTLKSLQSTINLGMQTRLVIHTPLMWIDKAATWGMAQELGGDKLVSLILESTHTCYVGDRSIRHEWGYGCGRCAACDLRSRGWEKFTSQKISA